MASLNRNIWLPWVTGIAVALLAAYPFFHDLGKFPIFQWDEARYANNSVEIVQNGHWLDYRMDGEIDHWNFKPPLVLWIQAGSMKLFGCTELGVRLPSALAGVAIALLLFWFCSEVLKSRLAGVVSVLFFLASPGFIGPHMGRTADLDAVQTLFVTLYSLYFARYLLENRSPGRTFATMALMVWASFLCKGMPGLLLLPFLGLIALLPKNYRKVLPYRSLYLYGGLALLACASYYLLREWQTPGYWALVKKSEFNRFSGEGLAWHKHDAWFYLRNFTELKRYPLIYFLPLTLPAFFLMGPGAIRRFFGWCWLIAAGYLAFISWPPVKLEWYDAPLYPFFALIFGLAVAEAAGWLARKFQGVPDWAIAPGIALLLCWRSFLLVAEKIEYQPDEMADFEREGVVINQLLQEHPDWLDYAVLKKVKHPEHLDQVKFYQKSFRQRFGVQMPVYTDFKEASVGQKVLVSQPDQIDSLLQRFPGTQTLYSSEYGRLLLLK